MNVLLVLACIALRAYDLLESSLYNCWLDLLCANSSCATAQVFSYVCWLIVVRYFVKKRVHQFVWISCSWLWMSCNNEDVFWGKCGHTYASVCWRFVV